VHWFRLCGGERRQAFSNGEVKGADHSDRHQPRGARDCRGKCRQARRARSDHILFAPVAADSRFDIIASNPPYIPTAEIATLEAEVAKHEPLLALDGGASGFDVIDRLIAAAPGFAVSKALFLMELSPEQADTASQKLTAAGKYTDITVRRDLAAHPRVMKARLP
jgi:release factor glutamine methyltransferase